MSESSSALTRFDADLISLRALVAIVDTGSFSSAARQIGRTQSAVSLQIAKLEERLGVRLLERNSRIVCPTTAGDTLIAYARRVISLADEAVSAVSAHVSERALRIGIDDFQHRQSLLDVLRSFRHHHPGTPLQLHFDPLERLHKALQANQLDVIVGHSLIGKPERPLRPGLDRTELLEEPLVWAATRESLSEQRPIPLVVPPSSSAIRQAALNALCSADLPWCIVAECNSVPAQQSAIQADLGLAALPLSALGDGILEITAGLPSLPASTLFVDVPSNDRHPHSSAILEQLTAHCTSALSRTLQIPAPQLSGVL